MNDPSRPPRAARAFTLVELLLALAIASALLVVAAPSVHAALAAAELRERARALASTLQTARSEAIRRGTRVDVCPGTDRSSCLASGQWESGWFSFVNDTAGDAPADGAPRLGGDRPAAPGITIRGNGPVARYVSYTALGHARRHDGALQMGTFTLCRAGAHAVKVVLANSGRTRVDVTEERCP